MRLPLAIAASALATTLTAAPAAAAPAPAPARVTLSVADVQLPKRGCATATTKVRVSVGGTRPWLMYANLRPSRMPHGWRPIEAAPSTGQGDTRFQIKLRLCADYPAGEWTGEATLFVDGREDSYVHGTTTFTVKPARR